MNIWNKLLQTNITNKERFENIFLETVENVQAGKFDLKIGERENSDHFVVVEENRFESYFIHIVPKEIYKLFKEIQAKAQNDFLGFSVLAGNRNNKPIRVSCFGVQCGLLGKSLLKSRNDLSNPANSSADS